MGIVVTFVPENRLDIYAALGFTYRLVSGRQHPSRLGMTADDGRRETEMFFENGHRSYDLVSPFRLWPVQVIDSTSLSIVLCYQYVAERPGKLLIT